MASAEFGRGIRCASALRRYASSLRPGRPRPYDYGAVAAAAGYSRDDAVQAAGLHNGLFSENGLTDDAQKNIKKGWDDADGGRWSR